jgi:hypothetical protein
MVIGGKTPSNILLSLTDTLPAAGELPKPPEKPIVFLEGRWVAP